MSNSRTVVYRYRMADKHASALCAQARAVNYVWNYCNETQQRAVHAKRQWHTANSLGRLCSGATREGLNLLASSVEMICRHYDHSRRAGKKPWLRWRWKRSLGWVPFRSDTIKPTANGVRYRNREWSAWVSRTIPDGARIGDGCFSQDALGRWYVNIAVTLENDTSPGACAVGIDLGLKALATLSDGGVVAIPQPYRRSAERVAIAQRAKKKRLATALNTKIANRRRDYLHKASAKLAKKYGLIVVGNVSPSQLARTHLAKSIHDAGWSDFRQMIEYKAIAHGSVYLEVNEAYTSRTCSDCGVVSGPEGLKGLGIREWVCGCGAVLDRDVNAAKNILRLGHQALAGGAALSGDVNAVSGSPAFTEDKQT